MKKLSRSIALLLAALMVICSCFTALADQEVYTFDEYDYDAFTATRNAVLLSNASVPTGGTTYQLDGTYSSLEENLTIDGKTVDVDSETVTVTEKSTFSLAISWGIPENITSSDIFTYEYPDELKLDGSFREGYVGNVEAYINNSKQRVGYWSISGGKLVVWFDSEEFLAYNSRNVTITLSGTVVIANLTDTSDPGKKQVDLQTKDPVVNVLTQDGLSIEKSGELTISEDNTATGSYTIVVTATKDLTNVRITDSYSNYYGNVSLEANYWVNSSCNYTGEGVVTRPSSDYDPYIISEMKSGESMTITYSAKIDYAGTSSTDVTVDNSATATSDQTLSVSDYCYLPFSLPEISKTGSFVEMDNAIYWTITVETNQFYDVKIQENANWSYQLDNVESTEVLSVTKADKNGSQTSISGITFATLEAGHTLDGVPGDVFTIELKSILKEAAQGSVSNYVGIKEPNSAETSATVEIVRSNLDYKAAKSGKLLPWTNHSSPVRTVEWTIVMDFTGSPALNFPYVDGTEMANSVTKGEFLDALQFIPRKMTLDRDSIRLLDANGTDVTAAYLEISKPKTKYESEEEDPAYGGFTDKTGSYTDGFTMYYRFKKNAPAGKYTLKYCVDYDPTKYQHPTQQPTEVSYDSNATNYAGSGGSVDVFGVSEKSTENKWIWYKGGSSEDDVASTTVLLNYILKSNEVDGDKVTWYIPFQYDLPSSDEIKIKDFWPTSSYNDVASLNIENAEVSLWYGECPVGYYATEATGTKVYDLTMGVEAESENYNDIPVGIIEIPAMNITGLYSDPAERSNGASRTGEYHYIKIEVPVSNYQSMTKDQHFENRAQISINGAWYAHVTSTATVTAPAKITKTHEYTSASAPYATYTIMVNEHRFKLLGDGESELYVYDAMDNNLIYKNNSLKVFQISEDNVETDVTDSMRITYTANVGTDSSALQIEGLQDETCYKITYVTLVNGTVYQRADYRNTASLMKSNTLVGSADDRLYDTIHPPVAQAAGSAPLFINVKKTDVDTGAPLSGAKFAIYTGYGTADQSAVVTLITNANGEFESNWQPNKNTAYTLVEIEAPEGYLLNEDPVVAKFGYFDGVSVPEGWTHLTNMLTVYEVTNEAGAKSGSLSITKEVTAAEGVTAPEKEFTFEVTLSGMSGDVAYQKNGTDGTLTLDNDGKGTLKMKADETVTFENIPAETGYTVTETNLPIGFSIENASKTGTIKPGETAEVDFANNYTIADLTITKQVVGKDAPETDSFEFVVEVKDGETALTGLTYKVGEGTAVALPENGKISLTKDQTATIIGIPVGATYKVTEAEYDDYTTKVGEEVKNEAAGEIAAKNNAVTFTNTYKYGSLTISKSFANNPEEGETFVFDVKDSDGNVVTQVVMTGSESVTIHKLPLGQYTVSENNAWSWRYSATASTETTVTITAEVNPTVSFTNTKNKHQWLDDSAYADNNFGTTLPKTIVD